MTSTQATIRRRTIWVATVLALLGSLLAGAPGSAAATGDGQLTVTFVDVRQGDAIVVTSPCGWMAVLDTPRYRIDDVRTVIDQHGGLEKVAMLSPSHYDADHLGDDTGLTGLIKDVHAASPHNIIVQDRGGDREAKDSATYRNYYDYVTGNDLRSSPNPGSSLTFCPDTNPVTFTVVAANGLDDSGDRAGQPAVTEENDLGLCYRIEYHDFDMATCGDVNGTDDGTRTNMETAVADELADVELAKVNHHGSPYSSNPTYVDALDAQAAVISVGQNSYGHPNLDVIGRWEDAGTQTWVTNRGHTATDGNEDWHGTITATTDGYTGFTVTPTVGQPSDYPLDETDSTPDDADPVLRHDGTGRTETAAHIATSTWDDGADTVLIASAATFPDALAGATYAGLTDAPVLLTDHGQLPDATRDAVDELGATTAVLLGGTAAVSTDAETQLRSHVDTVVRIAGDDRYATAAQIVKAAEVHGGADTDIVYLVSGQGFPDAVAASAVAAATGRPLLLTARNTLPQATADVLADLAPDQIRVVGGPAVVSETVTRAAAAAAGGADVGRIAGADRYATAVKVAEHAEAVGLDVGRLWVATGQQFPDALAAGPAAARHRGVLLLVNGSELTGPTADHLHTVGCQVEQLQVAGGEAAVAAGTVDQLEAAVDC